MSRLCNRKYATVRADRLQHIYDHLKIFSLKS